MLFIIGKNDNPIYDINLGIMKKDQKSYHLQHFIAHSSLDIIEEVKFTRSDMYIGQVDKHSEYTIYSFITAANFKFLLLLEHKQAKNENSIKNFFQEIYQLFTKILMNPLYDPTKKIKVPDFDKIILQLVKKFF